LAHFQKAHELCETLVLEAPDEEWPRASLAETCTNLGWMLTSLRRRDEAREYLVRARDIQEGLVARQPTSVVYRITLALTCERFATLEEGDAALAPQRRCVELREAIAREFPSESRFQADLAGALMICGSIHRNAKRFDEAIAVQERAIALMETVVR